MSFVSSILGGKKSDPAPVLAPTPTPEAKATKVQDVALREQSIGQRAAAAGATRSDNEADLLGYALPKKRTAGRAILG